MAWGKAGTKTLTSTSLSLDIDTAFTANIFTQHLFHGIDDGTGSSGDSVTATRPDNISTSSYSHRVTEDGTSNSFVNQDAIYHALNTATDDHFIVDYMCGVTGEELLQIGFFVDAVASGAGSVPTRAEIVNKYTGTPAFTTLTNTNTRGTTIGYEYDIGSNTSLLGSDLTPAAASSATISDGAIFYETDTNKSYVLYNGSWTEV